MEQKKAGALCATIILACSAELLKRNSLKKRRARKVWVKGWLLYNNIMNELKLTDAESFRKYLRINTATFQVKIFFNYNFNYLVRHSTGHEHTKHLFLLFISRN